MTLAEPIPELSVIRVPDQQGTIVHNHGHGEAYEVGFSTPSPITPVPS
jgi:hypothetical protein